MPCSSSSIIRTAHHITTNWCGSLLGCNRGSHYQRQRSNSNEIRAWVPSFRTNEQCHSTEYFYCLLCECTTVYLWTWSPAVKLGCLLDCWKLQSYYSKSGGQRVLPNFMVWNVVASIIICCRMYLLYKAMVFLVLLYLMIFGEQMRSLW